jgi:hypothetical protein
MNKEAFIQKLIRYLRNADEVEKALKPNTLPENIKRINMPGLEEMSRKGDLLRLNEAKDIAKQRQTMAALLGGGGVAIGGNELKDYLDSKEAAYLGGFMDKCAEYGLSQEEAEGLAKEAFPAQLFYTAGKKFKNMWYSKNYSKNP